MGMVSCCLRAQRGQGSWHLACSLGFLLNPQNLDIMVAEEGVSSSHLQTGLMSRCHSLQVRSPSTTFQ